MADDEVVSDDSVSTPEVQEVGSVDASPEVDSPQESGAEVSTEEVSVEEVSVEEVAEDVVEEELNEFGFAASDMVDDEEEEEEEEGDDDVSPIEEFVDGVVADDSEEV